ncbi:MAG TPA: hypothetical protein PLQ36_03160, partial [Candidatus Gracilibacteria bacterium]|nr:hypothetical protein [Candidatus Gracilibacteria bacterium]
ADIAVKSREDLLGGKLTIVRLPHSKSATVTDRLFGTYENLLVISADGESNFFGDGEVCQAFKDQYPNSWAGGTGLGKAKEYAFWGGYVDQKVLEEEIKTEVLRTLPPAEIIEGDLLPAISFYPIPDQMINSSESLTLDLKEYIPIYGGSIISKYRLLGDVEGVKFDAKNAIFQFNPKSPGVYCFNFQYLDEDGWSAQDFAVHVCSDFD